MKYSDEILMKSQQRGLTMSERMELREAYNWEKAQDDKSVNSLSRSVKEFKDEEGLKDLPRYRMIGKCAEFIECPIDFKCRNYNSSHIKCVNCVLHETEEVCMKPELHNERNFNMLYAKRQRERIDLDDINSKRVQ